MSRRLSIELTSNKGDGTWTWRAAGAREPRGLISADLLPKGAGISSVITAEVQSDMDGIAVLAVIESEDTRAEPETIQLLGTGKPTGVNYKGSGRDEKHKRGGGRGDGQDSKQGFSRRRAGQDSRRGSGQGKGGGQGRGSEQDRQSRPRPNREHRKNWLASVPPEHAALAEQISKFGPKQRSEDGEKPKKDIATQLQDEYRMAEWQDRADFVLANFEKTDLAEVRMLIADSDSYARTDQTREQADEARKKLLEREEQDHGEWLADLATHLSEGRVLRALRQSGQPPKAGVPLPLDLVEWLTTATNNILTHEAQPDRWNKTLQALAVSPVRRLVRPSHPPATVSSELTDTVTELRPRFPHIAALFIEETSKEETSEAEENPADETEDSEAENEEQTEETEEETAT